MTTPTPRFTVGQPTFRVVYQRRDPQQSVTDERQKAYTLGSFIFDEVFAGLGRLKRETVNRAYRLMEAYKTGLHSSVVENEGTLLVDQIEKERRPGLDTNGNEAWGSAIRRFVTAKLAWRAKVERFWLENSRR
jgi:hypothetical protein